MMSVKETLCLVLVIFGVFLMFVASFGLFRLPDSYTRMSAVTKAVTFKIGLIMIGACIYFDSLPIILKAIAIIFFLALTTPIASHLVAREAYRAQVPMWKKTLIDEFAKFNKKKPGKNVEKN